MKPPSFLEFIGLELNPSSHAEKLISGLGGTIAIFFIYIISRWFIGADSFFIVASMGAATVLLFAVPHGPLSQPWPLIGGNLISALIGVTSAKLIPYPPLAAACAVGLSVTAMYYLKCIHPPGGATALAAVISGPAVQALGYKYVITPVLINVAVIFTVAVLFNYIFKWRRYPAAWADQKPATPEYLPDPDRISHKGIEHAMRQIDSFIDVTEDDLNKIFHLGREYDRTGKK